MRTEEIVNRIRHGEDSRTQFKREAIGIARLAEELTAFANADGGVILFGVDDDGTVAGLDEAQRAVINRDLSNAANDGVRPAVYPRTEFHDIDGKVVLAIIVPEGCAKPYADKSGAYWTKSGVSIPRNPLLFSLAVKDGIPYRGIGTGVRRAVALVPGMVFENDPEGFFVKVVIKLQSPRNRTDKSDIRTDNASGDGKNRTDGAKIGTVKSENRTEEVVQGNLPKAMRRLLSALRNDILLTSDLMGRLSIRSRGAFSATYVKPGLRHGLLEMLYPDSKRSKKQAYRLTEKGLALLRLQESGGNCV